MDCITNLKSYNEVKALIETVAKRRIFNFNSHWEKFRGQGRPEYTLTPTIARGLHSDIEIREREEFLMNAFLEGLKKRSLEQSLRKEPDLTEGQQKWVNIIQAQHLSIPTRLLDWTISWEIALWFAVEDVKNDSVDGQFWILSVPFNRIFDDNKFLKLDFASLPQTCYINPAIHWSEELEKQIGEIKRFRQHGQFTISPYFNAFVPLEDHPNLRDVIEKYCIPAASKPKIREELDALGINKQFLYYEEHTHTELDELIRHIRSI